MDFDVSTLFAGIVFGTIGFGCWKYGRRTQSLRAMLLGFALIGYPWVAPGGLWLWVIGAGLTGLVFWP